MPVYEYQGQHYEIDTNDPAEAKRKILASLQPESLGQTFGRSAASLADTALNAITGTLDLGARALARGYYGGVKGMPLAEAEQRAQQEATSPKDIVGRAFGVTNTPGYQNAPLRQLGTVVGQAVGENVINPVAQATGLPQEYVSDVTGLGTMAVAPGAGRAAAATGRGLAAGGRAVGDVASGAYGTISGKIAKPGTEPALYRQTPPVMEPAGAKYIPADVMAEFQAGRISPQQAQAAAIDYTPAQIEALKRTGGMVPYSGNVAKATGAIMAEPYTSVRGYLADVGLAGLGGLVGGPVGAVALPAANMIRRGVGIYNAANTATAARQLGDIGFTPLTAAQRAQLEAAAGTPPVPGPVMPTPAPMPTSVSPAQAAQMAAAQRVTNMPPGTTPQAAAAQKIIGAPPTTMQMMQRPSPMQMTQGGPMPTIVEAAKDAMIQLMRRPDDFTVSYKDGNNIITETKRPGYHAVDIEFPDGSIQRMREHSMGDKKLYSSSATGTPFGQARSLPSSDKRPSDWITVLDQFKRK